MRSTHFAILFGSLWGLVACDNDALVAPEDLRCGANDNVPEVIFGQSIQGVLDGPSRNERVTCGAKTVKGADRLFRLQVAERSLVTLQFFSKAETVLALRRACRDLNTEIACGDSTIDPRHPNPNSGAIERILDPGAYYVIVDEVVRGAGMSAKAHFTFEATSGPEPLGKSCALPQPLRNTSLLEEETFEFERGTPLPNRKFYSVEILPDQRLTVSVTTERTTWKPRLDLLPACDQTQALGTSAEVMGENVLQHTNNGNESLKAILVVSAQGVVNARRFVLTTGVDFP